MVLPFCCSSISVRSGVVDPVPSDQAPSSKQGRSSVASTVASTVAARGFDTTERTTTMRSSIVMATNSTSAISNNANGSGSSTAAGGSAVFPSSIVCSINSNSNSNSNDNGVAREDSNLARKNKTFLQRLVHALRGSLEILGASPSNRQLESWAIIIHESMSVYGRYFHSVRHVFDISVGADAIQTLAALFHDCIYCSVDGGLLPKQADLLRGVISDESTGPTSTTTTSSSSAETAGTGTIVFGHISKYNDPMLAMVASVFGFSADQVLSTPFSGENEFLSAVLAVRCLEGVLRPPQLMQIVACIEMTIPFREKDDRGDGPAERLFARLERTNAEFCLGISQQDLTIITQRAVDLGNRDVENFCTTDTPWFLDNTWKLLPESNVPLRRKVTYTVCEYQQALLGMCGFFSNLNYKVVFNSFRGSPTRDELAEIRSRTKRNIQVAKLYIRAKLLSVSLIAALAELTGGDAPMALFVGDMPGREHYTDRLDDFIPLESVDGRNSVSIDEEVYDILKTGRKSDAKFDLANSPLAAYLYGLLGDTGVEEALRDVDARPMDKERSLQLLKSIPPEAVRVVIKNCAKIAITRTDDLFTLIDEHYPEVKRTDSS
mmetsp:Transcript_23335/g.50601  ORF Transcript_23335/g.50601 Transcript_23335/m.50601 type:complete len:606 (+) Transcript_23335:227-2044(+)